MACNTFWFFIPFSVFVIVGSSNAVNLTDGLDGLAFIDRVPVGFYYVSYTVSDEEKSTSYSKKENDFPKPTTW